MPCRSTNPRYRLQLSRRESIFYAFHRLRTPLPFWHSTRGKQCGSMASLCWKCRGSVVTGTIRYPIELQYRSGPFDDSQIVTGFCESFSNVFPCVWTNGRVHRYSYIRFSFVRCEMRRVFCQFYKHSVITWMFRHVLRIRMNIATKLSTLKLSRSIRIIILCVEYIAWLNIQITRIPYVYTHISSHYLFQLAINHRSF